MANDKCVIVVVDEDEWVHRAIAAVLPAEAFDVVPCSTARGALNACCALDPECVIAELGLLTSEVQSEGREAGAEAEDGVWLAAQIRRQPSSIAAVPIVLMSAKTDEETRLRALKGG